MFYYRKFKLENILVIDCLDFLFLKNYDIVLYVIENRNLV